MLRHFLLKNAPKEASQSLLPILRARLASALPLEHPTDLVSVTEPRAESRKDTRTSTDQLLGHSQEKQSVSMKRG